MLVVGVIEIVAGIGVALKPRIFAYIVAAWLALIIINLLLIPGLLSMLRCGISACCLAALALARLSQQFSAQVSHWKFWTERLETKGCQS